MRQLLKKVIAQKAAGVLAIALLLTVCAEGAPVSPPPSWMVGSWKFTNYIYHNEVKLPLNPNLVLIFQFFADGTDNLGWRRDGENGFCERTAHYSVDGNFLSQEVDWINPDNDISCSSDPEMTMGRKTHDEFHKVGDKWHLYLSLSGEPFIYVFERTTLPDRWPRNP